MAMTMWHHVVALLVANLAFHIQARVREYHFKVEAEWIAPDGYWREAYTINGQTPGPLIEADEGDTLRIHVVNNLNTPITFHWHGLLHSQTPWMDGVPGVTQWPILPKDQFTYTFPVEDYGSFWYHSHVLGTYDDGIRGPIYLTPRADQPRPWSLISNDSQKMTAMASAVQRAIDLQIFGWSHEMAEANFVQYKTNDVLPACFDSILLNGFGRVICPTLATLEEDGQIDAARQARFSDADVKGCFRRIRAANDQRNPVSCSQTVAPFPVYQTHKHADDSGQYMAMRIINEGTDTSLSVSVDSHDLIVYMVEGGFVHPQRVQIVNVKVGSRVAVLIPLDQPAGNYTIRVAVSDPGQLQLISGYGVLEVDKTSVPGHVPELVFLDSTLNKRDNNESSNAINSIHVNKTNTTQLVLAMQNRPDTFHTNLTISPSTKRWLSFAGEELNNATTANDTLYYPYPERSPPKGPADVTIRIHIDIGELYWKLADHPFQALHTHQKPLLFQDRNANLSAYHGTVFEAELDDIVDMVISTNVPVGHPLHKHHESFWIVGSGPTVNGSVPFNDTVQGLQIVPQDFNFDNPPLRDVAFLHGADSYLVLRWRVQFPTATLFHCHIEHHIASGMAIIIRQAADDFDPMRLIPYSIRWAAHVPNVYTNASVDAGGLDTF